MLEHPFTRVAAVLFAAAVIGGLAVLLRQPLIVGFIGVGVLVGPAGLGLVSAGGELELLAELGIAVLLFLVGLKLDPQLVRSTGPVALATGLGQVAFTSILGFGIALALGMEWLPALYVAVALTFSSTIIIVKLLADKRELDELHGRIAVGFLIVQDIVVVLALIAIAALGAAEEGGGGRSLLVVLGRGVSFLGGIVVLMRFVLPRLLAWLAHNRELLLLVSVAWAVGVSALGAALGFSGEVGAFLAGFALATTPYREAIASRLVSLRDFLLLFFFIELGAELEFAETGSMLFEAGIFSLFVLIGNPLIVLVIMGAMGYRARTSFKAGLTVAQISEFSLILVALGLSVGHVERNVLGLVTTVGLITIGLSTYLILYSEPIYQRLAPWLTVFERRRPHTGEPRPEERVEIEAIVFGLGRHGGLVAQRLRERGLAVLGIDIDPDALRTARAAGLDVLYGDASDPEFPLALPLQHARWVVSTVPHADTALALEHGLRAAGYAGRLVHTAHGHGDARRLAEESHALVLEPYALLAERLIERICEAEPEPPGDSA